VLRNQVTFDLNRRVRTPYDSKRDQCGRDQQRRAEGEGLHAMVNGLLPRD
jgi:hypothetical protein